MGDRGLPWEAPLGATPHGDGTTTFRVWAPGASRIEVEVDGRREPIDAAAGWIGDGALRLPPLAGAVVR